MAAGVASMPWPKPCLLDVPSGDAHRVVAARVDGLTVAGVCFAQPFAKQPLFDWMLGRPRELPPLSW
jgi:hypothetical protein